MASLVEQIYMQAKGGSAGGAGFADFLVQGRQANQRQQQLELNKQELESKLARLPLEMTLKRQESEMNAFKIQDVLENRQRAIQNQADMMELQSIVPRAFSETDDPAGTIRQFSIEKIVKNPYLASWPEFKSFSEQVGKMAEESSRLIRDQAYANRVNTAAGNLDLALMREDRLGDMFEFQKQKFAADIPRDRLSLFNARAQVIKNDLNLIGNTAEQVRQLNELAKEFGVGMPVTAVPSTTPPAPGKKIGRFEVVPK